MGIRIYQLAKEMGKESKKLLAACQKLSIQAKSHMSSLKQKEVERLRLFIASGGKPAAPREKAKGPAVKEIKKEAPEEAKGETLEKIEVEEETHVVKGAKPGVAEEPSAEVNKEKEKPESIGKLNKRIKAKTVERAAPGGFRRKRRFKKIKKGKQIFVRPSKAAVELPISVKGLSAALGIKAGSIIKCLLQKGVLVTINQFLDESMILEIALGHSVEIEVKKGKGSDKSLRDCHLITISS